MKVQHLMLKAGGRILEVKSVSHSTYKGVAEWFFVCKVQWGDTGKTSDDVQVMPYRLCYDHDNPEAVAEGDAVFEKMNEHLRKRGKWHDQIRKRDGRMVSWTPKQPVGETRLAA